MILLVVPFKEIKNDRVWVVAGVLAVAALGLGGWRINLWATNRPPSAIFFEVDSLTDGSVVRDKDVPLTVTGSYNGQAKGVRVVLQDKALPR
jgi:hypothetical protein